MSIFGWDFDETERDKNRERRERVKDARQVISGVKVRRGTCPQSHASTRSQVSLKRALTHATSPSLSLSLSLSLSFSQFGCQPWVRLDISSLRRRFAWLMEML